MSSVMSHEQVALLTKAIEFFGRPESWTQHEMGTAADGCTDLWCDELLARNCALPHCLCAEGALWWAAGQLFSEPKASALVEDTLERLGTLIPGSDELYLWNDAPERTKQDVINFFATARDAQA